MGTQVQAYFAFPMPWPAARAAPCRRQGAAAAHHASQTWGARRDAPAYGGGTSEAAGEHGRGPGGLPGAHPGTFTPHPNPLAARRLGASRATGRGIDYVRNCWPGPALANCLGLGGRQNGI